jgi:cytochrome c553
MMLFCPPDNLLQSIALYCTMKLISHLIIAATLVATPLLSFASEEKPAPAAAAPAAPAASKPDLVKGEAGFAACAACHGADGNSAVPTFPSLAQQHPEYLIKQLQEFKSDKRANEIMKGMATALSDEDMKNVSYFVAAKKAASTAAVSEDKKQLALGKQIYQGGVMDRQIPACAGCHSPTGAGIPAQYPRLKGQHADYTAAQITAFRDGVRANSAQMSEVAAKLNDREIKAVAAYIASLR